MNEHNKSGLQKARESKNLTLLELAEKLGVEVSAVKSWELGAKFPHPTMMKQLCYILNVSSDLILFNENRKTLDISQLTETQKLIVIDLHKKLRDSRGNI